jgi:hypothetical protein
MRPFLLGAMLVVALLSCTSVGATSHAVTVSGNRLVSGGQPWSPRGANYIEIDAKSQQGVTFDPDIYSASRIDSAFAAMGGFGYTSVRLFVWPTKLGSPSGSGLDQTYLANLTDAINRAVAHGMNPILSIGGIPATGGYLSSSASPSAYGGDTVTSRVRKPSLATVTPLSYATANWSYLTVQGRDAHVRAVTDLLNGLAQHGAPLSKIAAYDLTGEMGFLTNRYPLNQTSGTITTATGVYDLGDAGSRQQMMDDGAAAYAAAMSAAVHAVDPGALTGAQLQPPILDSDPSVVLVTPSAVEQMPVNLLMLSLYPTFNISLSAQMDSYHFGPVARSKPMLSLETGWFPNMGTVQQSIDWEVAACGDHVYGMLWFTWNATTNYRPMVADNYYFASGLASDPCKPKPAPLPESRPTNLPPPPPTPIPAPAPRSVAPIPGVVPNPLPQKR